eukprot:m.105496 g.105496  ORF g.105496 m.105496 type:complete len:100 (+) comp27652_c0_seq2:564-863(+)
MADASDYCDEAEYEDLSLCASAVRIITRVGVTMCLVVGGMATVHTYQCYFGGEECDQAVLDGRALSIFIGIICMVHGPRWIDKLVTSNPTPKEQIKKTT